MVKWWNGGLGRLCHLCSWRFVGPNWVKHGATQSDSDLRLLEQKVGLETSHGPLQTVPWTCESG